MWVLDVAAALGFGTEFHAVETLSSSPVHYYLYSPPGCRLGFGVRGSALDEKAARRSTFRSSGPLCQTTAEGSQKYLTTGVPHHASKGRSNNLNAV